MYGPPADAPKATCEKCGTVYVDWEDYSGSPHSTYECRDALVKRVAELEAALGARIERMEAWIKGQGHRNHACFERVGDEVVRHRSGRCECGYDAALAP